jgi:hypothetical protein
MQKRAKKNYQFHFIGISIDEYKHITDRKTIYNSIGDYFIIDRRIICNSIGDFFMSIGIPLSEVDI